MTVVMGAIATAVFVLTNRRSLIERWRYAVTAFAYSLGVACLLLFYPMWLTLLVRRNSPEHRRRRRFGQWFFPWTCCR